MAKVKTAKQMERHLKGMANHHRIEILLFIASNDGATLDDIVTALGANEKTLRKAHEGHQFFGGREVF
ncbi:MAG: hypothetical protein HYV52_00840 [Parcubacteria group bacterium]|nr:hypothetical protein [Parcubacteria group bacterium]